uniref:Uncharacterized protein n=1 Tax=Arundo donax TaxID=35708 RepID=A0A0A9CDF6_ARUDO
MWHFLLRQTLSTLSFLQHLSLYFGVADSKYLSMAKATLYLLQCFHPLSLL